MRGMLRLVSFAIICLASFAANAGTERRVALVIGNSDYKYVSHLANATSDARLIADTLKELGFTLVGGGPLFDLDKAELATAIRDFGREAKGATAALFYYAGHGVQVRGINWLVPVSANPTAESDVDFEMVDASVVLRVMEGANAKFKLMILDACRNNPFGSRALRALGRGLVEMDAPEGTLISYATQPGQVARDGVDGHSPFTKALVEAMSKPGLDVFNLFNEVGLIVKRITKGAQQPWVASSPLEGSFYFHLPETKVAALKPPVAPTPATSTPAKIEVEPSPAPPASRPPTNPSTNIEVIPAPAAPEELPPPFPAMRPESTRNYDGDWTGELASKYSTCPPFRMRATVRGNTISGSVQFGGVGTAFGRDGGPFIGTITDSGFESAASRYHLSGTFEADGRLFVLVSAACGKETMFARRSGAETQSTAAISKDTQPALSEPVATPQQPVAPEPQRYIQTYVQPQYDDPPHTWEYCRAQYAGRGVDERAIERCVNGERLQWRNGFRPQPPPSALLSPPPR